MNLEFSAEETAFREEVRTFIDENYPEHLKGGSQLEEATPEDMLAWHKILGKKGWSVPAWPVEYGGTGWTSTQRYIWSEENARVDAIMPLPFGVAMVAPVIYTFGTQEQKDRFLPKIRSGEEWWCQGYSEPGAGSDLAGLQTKCEDKGDHWLINGQKVWTSYADQADWIFCLVRTDTSVKHDGISFLVFDMQSEGVETRPIKLISGSSPFCETFFTDVKVPKEQLVGKLNAGWTIAKRLLQFERSSISAGGFGSTGGSGILPPQEYAKHHVGVDETGRLSDGDLRGRLAEHLMFSKAFGLTIERSTQEAKAGQEVGHTASIMKYAAAKLNQDKCEFLVETLGTAGLGWQGEGFDEGALKATRSWLRSKGNSIEGGTSEVNLNVIAKRVLGLLEHQ
ncbi:MAG: acyl-CoA dehydrogenase family protein [Henriciella sp.]